MAWDIEGTKTSRGSSADWVQEGNIEVFIFKNDAKRCRFLTKPIDLDQVMSEHQVSREEAQELVASSLMWEEWLMPIGIWEHTIPSIPGKRYFSTAPASREPNNPLAVANEEARKSGVSENKMLPFPLRKRFIVPAYFYEYEKVLFVKQSQEFFEEIATYINRQGHMIDFDIYKQGKGFQTKYKAIYIGESKDQRPVEEFDILAPKEVNMEISEEELRKKLGETPPFPPTDDEPKQETASQEQKQASSGDAGEFVMPFGSHKGKSLAQIADEGNREYLEFLKENSAGHVQQKVAEFLG